MNYKAANDCVLVDPEFKEKTDTGIILTEKTQEENKGEFLKIISVGPKVDESIKVGEFATFHHTAQPTMIILDGVKYLNFKQYDIIGTKTSK